MDPLPPNTDLLPPSLRALALGLLVETGELLLTKSRADTPVLPDQGERGPSGKVELWQALRCKCGDLLALVLRADDPGEAATYVLGYLPKHFEYVFEHVCGRKRRPVLGEFETSPAVLRGGEYDVGSA